MTISVTARQVRLCVTVGLVVATVFSVWVLFNHATGGSRAVERSGATLSGVIAAYYAAGILGGAIIGLLMPLTRRPGGSALVGAVGGMILFIVIQTARKGAISSWDRQTMTQTALLGTAFGCICGPWIARNLRR